jgi:thymidylate kinase
VFTEMLYNKGTINKDEYDLYNNFYSKLSFPIDLFVYLKVDPELAYKRILNRDRAAERSLQYEYLVELHDSYEREMNTLLAEHPDKLVVVDANTNLSVVKKNVLKILKNF